MGFLDSPSVSLMWKPTVFPPPRTGTLGTWCPSLTLLSDSKGDKPCSLHKGTMCLKLKFPRHIAGVEAGVVQGDIEHSDGHVLQVLAPVPLQAALEGALHLLVAISILIDLEVEKKTEGGPGGRVGKESRDGGRAERGTELCTDREEKGQDHKETQNGEG